LPELETLRTKYEGHGVKFLALSLEPDGELVGSTAKNWGVGMTVAVARSEALGPLGVNQTPSTAFLNPDGTINAAASGPKEKEWLERRIKELVPATSSSSSAPASQAPARAEPGSSRRPASAPTP
jgi:hypothetical protein